MPRVLEWSDVDGVGSLTTELIKGSTWSDLYWDIDAPKKKILEENLLAFIDNVLEPQLKSLRSKTMGQIGGGMYPPNRITFWDRRPEWHSKTSSTDRYVFCHNDLNIHNFMMDPETLTVKAVVDWEYSGYFPPELEYPFYLDGMEPSLEEEHCKEMIALLDAPGESKQCCKLEVDWD